MRARVSGRHEQRVQAGEDRREVVHPAGREEGPVETEPRAGGGVRREDVVADDLVRRNACERGEVGQDVTLAALPDAVDRARVALAVERQAGVRVAVEVDGELRDAHEGAGADEVLGAVAGDEAAGELELAVEP